MPTVNDSRPLIWLLAGGRVDAVSSLIQFEMKLVALTDAYCNKMAQEECQLALHYTLGAAEYSVVKMTGFTRRCIVLHLFPHPSAFFGLRIDSQYDCGNCQFILLTRQMLWLRSSPRSWHLVPLTNRGAPPMHVLYYSCTPAKLASVRYQVGQGGEWCFP